ncbi:MAG: response regulator [Blautia sp.]|nr:response regulator [Blautia sp.]
MKLLMVDDNKQLLEGLSRTIDWSMYEITSVSMAVNGREALELFQRERPDIVITDILMPEMTGLEFLDIAKSINPNVKVIIMSGHAEFQYAMKAIQLGAVGYELKPIRQDALLALVLKAVEEIKETRIKEDYHLTRQQEMRNGTLLNILSGLIKDKAEIHRFFEESFGIGRRQKVSLIVCKVSGSDSAVLGTHWMRIQEICGWLLREDKEFQWIGHGTDTFFVLVDASNSTLEQFYCVQKSIRFLNNLNKRLKEYGIVFQSGFGISHTIDEICIAYAEAVEELSYIEMNPKLLCCERDKPDEESVLQMSEIQMRKRKEIFRESVQNATPEEKIEEIFLLFDQYRIYRRRECIDISVKIAEELQNHFDKLTGSKADIINSDFLSGLYGAESYLECKEICIYLLRQLEKQMVKQNPTLAVSVSVRKAQRYIEEHYSQQLTVAEIAKEAGVTANYLSHSFSLECGVGITEYINLLRIKKAKELLVYSDKMVYEIAEETGYSNYIYFNQVFKKIEGISPSQYRKKNKEL